MDDPSPCARSKRISRAPSSSDKTFCPGKRLCDLDLLRLRPPRRQNVLYCTSLAGISREIERSPPVPAYHIPKVSITRQPTRLDFLARGIVVSRLTRRSRRSDDNPCSVAVRRFGRELHSTIHPQTAPTGCRSLSVAIPHRRVRIARTASTGSGQSVLAFPDRDRAERRPARPARVQSPSQIASRSQDDFAMRCTIKLTIVRLTSSSSQLSTVVSYDSIVMYAAISTSFRVGRTNCDSTDSAEPVICPGSGRVEGREVRAVPRYDEYLDIRTWCRDIAHRFDVGACDSLNLGQCRFNSPCCTIHNVSAPTSKFPKVEEHSSDSCRGSSGERFLSDSHKVIPESASTAGMS